MKKLFAIMIISVLSETIISQTDTLFLIKDKKVNCKIIEINDFEIKYKLPDLPDGPIYTISKNRAIKYVLADGNAGIIVPFDQTKNKRTVSGGRNAIKILPISGFMDHVSLTYERVLAIGFNLDIEAGLVNNSMFGMKSFVYDGKLYDTDPPFYYGFYFKPGIKVLLGNGLLSNSAKPIHPLKGHYVRLDLAYSYLRFPRLTEREFSYFYLNQALPVFDVQSMGFGVLVNYGCQFVFGERFTFDYSLGIGFAFQENKCLNPVKTQYGDYGLDIRNMAQIARYGAFYRYPNAGVSGSTNLKFGYVFGKKKKESDTVKK